jgi:ribokinase
LARVCVVGSTNVDLTFVAERLARPGETVVGHDFRLAFGGKGANQAVAAARLGAAVAIVSCVGADPFGEQARRNYQDQGVDVRHVRVVPDRPTGTAAILLDDQAQNSIIVVAGANAQLSADDVRAAAPAIASADVLLCQYEVPLEATRAALLLARQAGVRTVLNPAPARPTDAELLALADLCVPNESEAEALTGLPAGTPAEAERAARALRAGGAAAVIVTLGERGAVAVTAAGAEHFPALAVQAVDTTGAGDAFIGALAVFLAEGLALAESVRRAGAAAALAVTRPGAQGALPTRAEVEHFLHGKP